LTRFFSLDSALIKKKICLLGNEGAGKSSLANRFATDSFSEDYKSTIGVKLFTKLLEIDSQQVKLVIWDMKGGSDSYSNNSYYYNGAFAHILLSDISSEECLKSLPAYYKTSKDNYLSSPCYLCFSKTDLEPHKNIESYRNTFEKEMNFTDTFYTSAKEGTGVSNMFAEIAKKAIDSQRAK